MAQVSLRMADGILLLLVGGGVGVFLIGGLLTYTALPAKVYKVREIYTALSFPKILHPAQTWVYIQSWPVICKLDTRKMPSTSHRPCFLFGAYSLLLSPTTRKPLPVALTRFQKLRASDQYYPVVRIPVRN
jgi:hypothetical protein